MEEEIEVNEINSEKSVQVVQETGTVAAVKSNRSKRLIDDKNRKKDEKFIDNLLRNLKVEEKVTVLTNKCLELLAERRNGEQNLKSSEKNYSILQRQCDQITADKSRQILINSRLQNLCRELQKQNKTIKDETSQRSKWEETKRTELSNRFQTTINAINNMMQEGNESNTKLRDDNIALNTKFQTLCSHVEKREEQAEALMKQMDIERKLSEATIEQRNCELLALEETYRQEKEILIAELEAQKLQGDGLRKTSENLRQQIVMYKEQCEDFHSAVAKSNNMFETFQSEMDKMSKKLIAMEKENIQYQDKWKKSNLSLIDVCRENQQLKIEQVQQHKQLQILKDLCRTMQTERQQLYQRLEEQPPTTPLFTNNQQEEQTINDHPHQELDHQQLDHQQLDHQQLKIDNKEETIIANANKMIENQDEKQKLLDDKKFAEKEETLRLLKSSLNMLQGELTFIQKNNDQK